VRFSVEECGPVSASHNQFCPAADTTRPCHGSAHGLSAIAPVDIRVGDLSKRHARLLATAQGLDWLELQIACIWGIVGMSPRVDGQVRPSLYVCIRKCVCGNVWGMVDCEGDRMFMKMNSTVGKWIVELTHDTHASKVLPDLLGGIIWIIRHELHRGSVFFRELCVCADLQRRRAPPVVAVEWICMPISPFILSRMGETITHMRTCSGSVACGFLMYFWVLVRAGVACTGKVEGKGTGGGGKGGGDYIFQR